MFKLTLVDTDIIIDAGRGVQMAVALLNDIEDKCLVISIVTQMELVVGCRNKTELKDLGDFLQRFQIVNIGNALSQIALELLKRYRLSRHGLLIPDCRNSH